MRHKSFFRALLVLGCIAILPSSNGMFPGFQNPAAAFGLSSIGSPQDPVEEEGKWWQFCDLTVGAPCPAGPSVDCVNLCVPNVGVHACMATITWFQFCGGQGQCTGMCNAPNQNELCARPMPGHLCN